jgi:plasmid maintenance system killer protein
LTAVVPVIILFKTKKLKKSCSDDAKALKEFGKSRARKIRQRLDDLDAADNLQEMTLLPGRFHALKGNRAGQLSLDLDGPYRLIFEAIHPDGKSESAAEWVDVTAVRILSIEDTHG